jgi:hypothetical protein
MPVTTSNLLMGPAKLYFGAVGSTEPPSNATVLGAPWTDIGGTTDGLTLTINQTYTPMMVDQVAMPVGSRKTEQGVQVATNLAEATLANLRMVLNQATAVATFTELDADISNADPLYQAVCIEGQKPGGGTRRVFVRRTLSTESIEMPFTKDGMTVVPVTFTAYYVSSTVKAIRIDDTP